MSAVWVRRDEAERGGLPARCARSGERCITRYPRRISDLPAPVEWATWTGLWPRDHGQPSDHIVLPVLPRQQRFHQLLRRTRDVSAALLGISLVALLVLDGLPGAAARVVGLAALAAHLLAALLGMALTIEVREDASGRWVRLSGVHRDFVAAVEETTTRPDEPPVLADPTWPGGPPATGEESRAGGESDGRHAERG